MNIASIDIGTNTVLLLIAEVDLKNQTFTSLRNEHRMPRIGKRLNPGLPINSDKIKSLKTVLKEYKIIIDSYDVIKVILTATNPFRIASNRECIIKEVREEFNYKIKVISGEEEAYYSFLGATSGILDKDKFLVIDIGGGSTEIIYGSRNDIYFRKSFQIGAVSATEKFFINDPPTPEQVKLLNEYIQKLFRELKDFQINNAFPVAIAGTPTTLSSIKHGLKDFSEKVIELSELGLFDINKIISDLLLMSSQEIKNKWRDIMKGREDIILAGSLILLNLLKLLGLDNVYTSTKGIRYGAIVKFMIDNQE